MMRKYDNFSPVKPKTNPESVNYLSVLSSLGWDLLLFFFMYHGFLLQKMLTNNKLCRMMMIS